MKLLSCGLVFLLAVQAWALEVPRSIALGNSDFTSRTLGVACFGMDVLIDGLPCNPAFAGKERRRRFQAQFFFGNNVTYASEMSRLLEGKGDPEMVEKLFSQKSSAEAEANIQISYLRENGGLQYSPYRLYYYALIRNSSLPVVTLYTGQEQILAGQIASYAEGNWFWGLQLRAVERKFILSEFTLTDALASGGSQYFDLKRQKALYIEPGLLYEFADKDWKPQVGLTVKNAGMVDTKYPELSTRPDWDVAGSVRPPVGLGELELGMDLRFNSRIEEYSDLVHLGLSYRLGVLQALASYAEDEHSLGFVLHYNHWNGGLSYWHKRYENLQGNPDQLRTVYLELGFVL